MKTIIYDLDGTLLNTLYDLADAVNYALNKQGYPSRSYDEIRSFIGNGVRILMNRCTDFKCTPDEIDSLLSDFTPHYLAHMYDKTAPYNGICEIMKKLKDEGYQQAIASNKLDSAVKELCGHYFPYLYDAALGAPQDKRKPDPTVLNMCIDELGAIRENVIYVGDTEIDLQTAKNAGVTCIAACWGFRDKEFLLREGAEYTAETPEDLYRIINVL